MIPNVRSDFQALQECRSMSCVQFSDHHNNNKGPHKSCSMDLTFAVLENNISPIKNLSGPVLRPLPDMHNCQGYQVDNTLNHQNKKYQVDEHDVSELSKKSSQTRRPTSIFIGGEPRRTHSPPLTSSPIGCTLSVSSGVDLNRSGPSESFNIASHGEQQVLDIRVFFSNGKAVQFPVENGQEAKTADVLELMTEHLEIDLEVGSEVLALWLVSPLLEVQLKPYHVPFEVRKKWDLFLRRFTTAKDEQILFDEPLLVLRRNVHLSVAQEVTYDDEYERLTEVLYLDAKDEYLSGRYLVDLETCTKLTALQMAIEYDPFESQELFEDMFKEKMTDLVPAHCVNRVKSFHLFGLPVMECKKGCEREIRDEYKRVSEELSNNHTRRKAYLNLLRRTPFYGAAFFSGTADRKPVSALKRLINGGGLNQLEVVIGVSHDLITVVDKQRHELLLTRADQDEDIPSFFLHFPDDLVLTQLDNDSNMDNPPKDQTNFASCSDKSVPVSRLLQILTKQAPLIDSVLNVVYERSLSDYGSAEYVCGAESPTSNGHSEDGVSPATSTTGPVPYSQSSKSVSSSMHSGSSFSSNSSLFSNSKLSRLCLATLDPTGRCVEAHGSLRRILHECN